MPSGIAAGLRAAVSIPLLRNGTTIGVVVIRSYDDVTRFTEDDARLLDLFAVQAAIAVENARLYATAQQELAERTRAEEALARQAATLRAQAQLLDLAHDAILVRDPQTSAIRFWNHGAEELYGWLQDEAVGSMTHTLLQTTFPQPLEQIQAEVLRTGRW